MSANTDAPSRYEINRAVRSVLTSHGVDLEVLSISSSSSLVYLNGLLKKATGQDLKPVDIDVIFREIERVPKVRAIVADLENWIVTNSEGGWLVALKSDSHRTTFASAATSASADQEDYRIKGDEKITDVLDDLKKKEG
ncbi:MAG: hypothetical protein M0P16_12730 [Syntrophales bacterium]|jgi:hypothetical protein|nr:hypothetical protein [Syntrophales bacterium]MCK9390441.1 hypothetical protein [Syntrophales bacterium]